MSRSIHHTFRHYWNEEKYDYADPESRAAELRKIRKSLERKRAIKKRIRAERKGSPALPLAPDHPGPLRPSVQDQDAYVHYPLTESDVKAVIEILPAGICDGLSSITLCLGKAYMEEYASATGELSVDPFTGRHYSSDLPGLFLPPVLGSYRFDTNEIKIYAYVYDKNTLKISVLESYLKLKMLNTLLHELSHHDDHMRRMARGRWLGCEGTKAEDYAYTQQKKLLTEKLMSTFCARHEREMSLLSNWIEKQGGCKVPLSAIAEGGILFTVSEAVEELFIDVMNAEPHEKVKYNFANYLHYAGCYGEALSILGQLGPMDQENIEVRLLMADIYCHQQLYNNAEPIANEILQTDPANADALYILSETYFAGERWPELIEITERARALSEKIRGWWLVFYLEKQLLAFLFLGDIEKAKAALFAFPESTTRSTRRKLTFQSLLLLLDGQFRQASDVANGLLLKKRRLEKVERAIGKFVYNAAVTRLGKATLARKLSQQERRVLKEWKLTECLIISDN